MWDLGVVGVWSLGFGICRRGTLERISMSELRTSLRRLRRSPGYLAAAVLSLATGTAVCVAAFSLVDVMVFEDVPGIRDRRNLIRINWTTQGGLFTTAELETLEQMHLPAL